MRCFVHHDHEAIGICRACGKALCPDCAVDLGHAICCRGACEQMAREIHAQTIRNNVIQNDERKRLYSWFSALAIAQGTVYALFGLIFLMYGWQYFVFSSLYLAPGLVQIVLGFWLLRLRRRTLNAFNRNSL